MNKLYILLGAAALSVTATAAGNGSRIDLSKKVKTSAIKEQAKANKPEI